VFLNRPRLFRQMEEPRSSKDNRVMQILELSDGPAAAKQDYCDIFRAPRAGRLHRTLVLRHVQDEMDSRCCPARDPQLGPVSSVARVEETQSKPAPR
jgi:hypothetical protein